MKTSSENWGSWSFVKDQAVLFELGSNISCLYRSTVNGNSVQNIFGEQLNSREIKGGTERVIDGRKHLPPSHSSLMGRQIESGKTESVGPF